MACNVVEGDVVRVLIRGDNGDLKPRYCVILERYPPLAPQAVMLMFCCSDTKRGSIPVEFLRVEPGTNAYNLIGLKNASTFHQEDIRAFDAHSPQLAKVGRCPRGEFLELKAMYQAWRCDVKEVKLLPEHHAREAAAVAVQQMFESPPPKGPEG